MAPDALEVAPCHDRPAHRRETAHVPVGRLLGGGVASTDAEQGRMPPLKQINASCGALLGAVVRYPAHHIRADALKGLRRPVLNLSK